MHSTVENLVWAHPSADVFHLTTVSKTHMIPKNIHNVPYVRPPQELSRIQYAFTQKLGRNSIHFETELSVQDVVA